MGAFLYLGINKIQPPCFPPCQGDWETGCLRFLFGVWYTSSMNKPFKKITDKKNVYKSIYKHHVKSISESQFWKKIALEQQILLHAKNNT